MHLHTSGSEWLFSECLLAEWPVGTQMSHSQRGTEEGLSAGRASTSRMPCDHLQSCGCSCCSPVLPGKSWVSPPTRNLQSVGPSVTTNPTDLCTQHILSWAGTSPRCSQHGDMNKQRVNPQGLLFWGWGELLLDRPQHTLKRKTHNSSRSDPCHALKMLLPCEPGKCWPLCAEGHSREDL